MEHQRDQHYRTEVGNVLIEERTGDQWEVVGIARCEELVIDGRYWRRKYDDTNVMYAVAPLGIQAAQPETFRKD